MIDPELGELDIIAPPDETPEQAKAADDAIQAAVDEAESNAGDPHTEDLHD